MWDHSVIEDDVMHVVYTEMLLKLDARYLSPSGYSCLEKYFITINR